MPKYECREPGCQKWAVQKGVCVSHGAKVKKCSEEGCTKQAQKGGVCIKHGASVKRCSNEGCTNQVVKGGVCMRHGAKRKLCSKEGCTNQALKGGLCRRHGAKVKQCSIEGCTNIVVRGGVCMRHGARLTRCSKEGCTNQVQRKGRCKRHGAYKRSSPDEANQQGDEINPPLPPLPAIEAVEDDERDQETARPLTGTAVEMEGNNSQLSGELTAATAGSVDQRVFQGEAPEQVTETPPHSSDVEDDWEGNHDSGAREDLAEDLEESGMESSQPPFDIGEEASSNIPGDLGESVAVGVGLREDRLQTAPTEDEAGEIFPSLSGVDNSGASSGESAAVGVGRDWQSQVGDGEDHVDSVGDSGRSKRTIEGGNEFSSTKRQRTEMIDMQHSLPSNVAQLESQSEVANLKAALVEKGQDIRALQRKLSTAENANSDLENKKVDMEKEMQALKESLDKATKSQSDDDSCLICCREHKVTCPRCSFSMCRNCLVMQYLSTRHEYDTEAGYGIFEQDPTKCPGCKLENAFVLEDEEQNVVDKANQRSGVLRSRGQRATADRERADADESIADDGDDDDDDASFEPSVDDDSSSDYEPSSEDGSASRVGQS